MDQEVLLKQIVEEVMKNINGSSSVKKDNCEINQDCKTDCKTLKKVDASSYPLSEKIPDQLKSPTGKVLSDMTLDKLLKGEIGANDMRISPETLELQAQVSDSVGREAFAKNLRRASELIAVPDERLLQIYNDLRPYRSTKQELYDIADELETKYNCKINSKFIREAADVYEVRGRLRKD